MNRHHFMFTGRKQGHPYCLIIKPAATHSGYEAELTTAYPTDGTISGQWLRSYLPDADGALMGAQQIRRNILHYVEV